MNLETVTLAHNAVTAKLHNPSREVKLEVQRLLSYMVAGAEQTALFKTGKWDGRSSFLDFRTGTFPSGFVYYVLAGLKRGGYSVNLVRKPFPEALGPLNPVVDKFPPDERYDYQPDVVNRLLKHGMMIAQVATGGGKSKIAKLCIARINRPTLFLTTRSILMYQMKDAIERDMGVTVSVLGDGQFGHTITDGQGNERMAVKKVCVAMTQTLISRLEVKCLDEEVEVVKKALNKREISQMQALVKQLNASKATKDEKEKAAAALTAKLNKERPTPAKIKAMGQARVDKQAAIREQTIRLLEKFELVIGEEAHEASGNSYYEILRHCKNAHYRLALTATPFMKENEEDNMRLMAAFGSVGIRVTEKTLIDRGILAKPYFKIVNVKSRPAKLFKGTDWQNAYRLGIAECEERNKEIVDHAVQGAKWKLPVMVLVQRTEHGAALTQALIDRGLRARFIRGENDQAERKEALQALAKGEIDVLLGSTILDVGVDVPAVGMVILAGGGKAEVALRQRIGRGLRAKKIGPNICFIVDFTDQWNNHLLKHATQRLEIIKNTPGFAENIIPEGQDFNYSVFEVAKIAA